MTHGLAASRPSGQSESQNQPAQGRPAQGVPLDVQPAQERPAQGLSQPVRPQGNALDSEASAGCPGSVPCGICARTGLRHCFDTVCLGWFWACNACIETFCIVCVRRHHCDIARQAVCHSKPLYAIWEYDEAQRYPCQYFVSNTCTKCDRTGCLAFRSRENRARLLEVLENRENPARRK